MVNIQQYTKKNGETAYMFRTYLGMNEITGKQVHTTRRGFKTKKEATLELARLKHITATKGVYSNSYTTFEEVYKMWWETYKIDVRESTQRQVLFLFKNHILPVFAQLKISKVKTAFCQKVVSEWYRIKGIYKIIIVYTKMIFKHAKRLRLIEFNPFDDVIVPRQKQLKKDHDILFYTKEELNTFLSFFTDDLQYYTLFRLLAYSGMRINEVLALTWADIDFYNKIIKVNKTVSKNLQGRLTTTEPKTTSSTRDIHMDNNTMATLKEWKAYQQKELFKIGINANNKSQLVFSTQKNKLLRHTVINCKMDNVIKKHHFKKIKVHGLRHTHCSLLLESGVPIQAVQERMGHSTIKTTMEIYTHISKKQKNTTAQQFAEFMEG